MDLYKLLPPLTAFTKAVQQADSAARHVLPLISATLHAQFPTGTHLVLTRGTTWEETGLFLDSVRDAEGRMLRDFTDDAGPSEFPVRAADGTVVRTVTEYAGMAPLPVVPAELADQWEEVDPRSPHEIVALIDRLDAQVQGGLFDFLPGELQTGEEIEAQEDGGPTPLWLPLAPLGAPRCALCARLIAVHAGRVCTRS
ncbi:hypothetical protein ACWDXD_24815 [Streptomyces sp. NPDC003314]